MDDDAGEEEAQDPPFTRRWMATSSYDVYMVDAPKENSRNDKENLVENKPPETQHKRQRPRRRSKSRRSKDSNTGTGEKIILWTMPKTIKTLLRQHPNRRSKKTGKLAPTNRPGPTTRRTVVIVRSLRIRKASAMKISSCLRNLSSRSASSAS